MRAMHRYMAALILCCALCLQIVSPPRAGADPTSWCGIPLDSAVQGAAVTDLSVAITKISRWGDGEYVITFRTSESGGLAPGQFIKFTPCGVTTFRVDMSLNQILVNGRPAGTQDQPISWGPHRTLSIPVPVAIAGDTQVTVTLLADEPTRSGTQGILNPASVGTHEFIVETSSDTRPAKQMVAINPVHTLHFNGQQYTGFLSHIYRDPTANGALIYATNEPILGPLVATVTSESDPTGIQVILNEDHGPLYWGEFGFTNGSNPKKVKVTHADEPLTARLGDQVTYATWTHLPQYFQISGTQDLEGMDPSQTIIELVAADGSPAAVLIADGTKEYIYGWRGGDVQLANGIAHYTFLLAPDRLQDSSYRVRVSGPSKEGLSAPLAGVGASPKIDPTLKDPESGEEFWPIQVDPIALHSDTTPPAPPVVLRPVEGEMQTSEGITVEVRTEPFHLVEIEFADWSRRSGPLPNGEWKLWRSASPGITVVTITAYDRSGNASTPVVRHITSPHSAAPAPEVPPALPTPPTPPPLPLPLSGPPQEPTSEPAPKPVPKAYSDLTSDHWAAAAVTSLTATGIVQGVDETRFAPSDPLTRAQFAALLVRSLELAKNQNAQPFYHDVQPSDWYYVVVQAATEAKLVTGGDGAFRPEAEISRQEMAVMLARALALRGKTNERAVLSEWADAADIGDWASESVAQVTGQGLMSGRPGHRFDPATSATRAEAALVIYRLLQVVGQR